MERQRLMRLGRAGDPEAAFRIYQMYDIGLHRRTQAFKWLLVAAANGHKTAAYNLGFEYYYHRHDAKNAAVWWQIAAESGDTNAQKMLLSLPSEARSQ